MKVQELVDKLREFPPELHVVISVRPSAPVEFEELFLSKDGIVVCVGNPASYVAYTI